MLSSSELLNLSISDLESLIRNHPKSDPQAVRDIVEPKKWDEKAYDRERKAKQRASGREVYIPVPENYERRLACLKDPELLLTTYFKKTYYEPFTEDRKDMLWSIWDAARFGGDQAIAGPRGEGKTTLAMDSAFCLMLADLSPFPVVIGKNQDAATKDLRELVDRIADAEEFAKDFPEIAMPIISIGAATANARLQTVNKQFIRMVISDKFFCLPTITKEMLPHWPSYMEPVSHGQVMGATGIEGRIRGMKFRSRRPTVAVIDDIEDKDSARNDEQIAKNDSIIEEDIGGMGASAERIARVYLCTTLNRKCNAFRFTDRKIKPSFNGRRYRKMIKPPGRMDLVEQYIELRKNRKEDDPQARVAFRFWRDRQEEIERDCVISNPYSYSKKIHEDGEPMQLSAIHAYYDNVADRGAKAVATEIDNDPPEDTGPRGSGITAQMVQSRISGLSRRQLPANTAALTAAIDLGKYRCHWVVTAWWHGAGGVVVDYGVAEVHGQQTDMTTEASEPAIYHALLNWRDELNQKNFVDATGTPRKVDFCLVDSGNFTNAAYQFCREVGGIFKPSKGYDPYHARKTSTDNCIAGANMHAQRLAAAGVWLYELDTSYWKQFIHERFMTPTFDENNMLRRGSLSLFSLPGNQTHQSYSQHIVAEELVSEFIEGKGNKVYWSEKSDNNHWLDATYMAAAASEACGIKLFSSSDVELVPTAKHEEKPKPRPANKPQHGSRFKQRPGGWIPRRR